MKYFVIIFALTTTNTAYTSQDLDNQAIERLRDANQAHLSAIEKLTDSLKKEEEVLDDLRENLKSERYGWRRTLSNMKYFCFGAVTVLGIYHIGHMIHGNSRPSTLCEKPIFKKLFG